MNIELAEGITWKQLAEAILAMPQDVQNQDIVYLCLENPTPDNLQILLDYFKPKLHVVQSID